MILENHKQCLNAINARFAQQETSDYGVVTRTCPSRKHAWHDCLTSSRNCTRCKRNTACSSQTPKRCSTNNYQYYCIPYGITRTRTKSLTEDGGGDGGRRRSRRVLVRETAWQPYCVSIYLGILSLDLILNVHFTVVSFCL